MNAATENVFGALGAWQAMLDQQGDVFHGMVPGSCVAIVPREGSGIHPGKHVAGLKAAAATGSMLRWQVTAGGMQAEILDYPGFQEAGVDLLFVAEPEALESLCNTIGEDTLRLMKRQIRAGSIMFFVMRNKYELQDAGYEEFLDSLGLAFLGACR